jgi:class 3 adenylate cyclase
MQDEGGRGSSSRAPTTFALPTGTVTFLFTDVEGSTRLLSSLGATRYRDVLARHQEIVRAAVSASEGREIDTQGDGFFFAFARATNAAVAAVAAQRALASEPWPAGSTVRVRMGIDTGEPAIGGDRYVSLGIHRTARIMAAGHGGQILVSETTRGLIEDELPPDVRLRDLGARRLKDLDRPVRLFQLEAAGLQSAFPSVRTIETHSRRRWMLGVVAIAAAAGAAAILLTRGGSKTPVVVANSVAVLRPADAKVVADVTVGDTPMASVVGDGAVWVLNANEQTLSSIDPTTRKQRSKFPAGAAPISVAVSNGRLWVSSADDTLTELDPGSGSVLRTIALPRSASPLIGGVVSWVAAREHQVWATGKGTAERIAPSRLHGDVGGLGCCTGLGIGGGSVWLAGGRSIRRLDASTGSSEGTIALPFAPSAVVFGFGSLWVVDSDGNKVWAVDAKTNEPTGSASVGVHPTAVAAGFGSIWVASADGSVTRVDPETLRVQQDVVLPGTPSGIAVGAGAVWVSVD